MAFARKCDLCGCLYETHDRPDDLVGFKLIYGIQKYSTSHRAGYFDLCYSCALELMEYLNSKKPHM